MEIPARTFVALLFRRTPVKNVPLPARVVAGAVGTSLGRLMVQTAEDLNKALERIQGLEGPLHLEIGPLAGGPPQEAGIAPFGK